LKEPLYWKNAFRNTLQHLYDVSEIDAIFHLCLEVITGDRSVPLEHLLSEEDGVQLQTFLEKLATSIPIQYILHKAYFWDSFYKVTPHTLIPRPETEELLYWLQQDVQKGIINKSKSQILDIGTGSGCIAITAKKILPEATVYALDISEEALQIAKENALIQQQEIYYIQDNILKPTSIVLQKKWDILLSNPPYITLAEKQEMHTNVLAHEPHHALFVTNNDPQQFYKAIVHYALTHLNTGGCIYIELNAIYGKDTQLLFQDAGFETHIKKDMQGKDRMLKAWKKDS
jgi:release factor glutamine methyltransferase